MIFFEFTLHILVISVTLNGHAATNHSKHPIIVLIAFDGFRYDYLERGLTPILQDLARNGSTSEYMMNQFPTVTFTNFHSISTGMYPETHGVLGNKIFDNDFRQCLTFGYELFHYNDDIVPIWHLNENAGDERYSGIMMWPGSQFKYQQKFPTFVEPFNVSVGWERRVDRAISWLVDKKTPANLILMYFEQPDEKGHEYGPQSEQVDQVLGKINEIMRYYLEQLSVQGIGDVVNTIVISDHGMETIDKNNILDLDNYIDPNAYILCGFSPILQIQPKKGFESMVYMNLSKASADTNKFNVYERKDVPERWHIKNNKRFSDIFIENKLPYIFKDAAKLKGNHGYNNTELSMHPIFIAHGPIIKRNYTIEPFQNIDIYPFIALVLDLPLPPVHISPNGTKHFIQKILDDGT